MSNPGMKQVRVDNWGTYFLQRLKHFFNRTDYCDLTLQFQDNAQLKVHRLVLNACTEYFELLERTCEMYEDCLIMPDDLQADVVLPIINFMYTGLLDYDPVLYHRLYSTAQIMNMHVLTKLLESQRPPVTSTLPQQPRASTPAHSLTPGHTSTPGHTLMHDNKKVYTKRTVPNTPPRPTYTQYRDFSKKPRMYRLPPPSKPPSNPPRPTRYELHEDEDPDDFESSFADISYETKPLKHPEFYKPKQTNENYTVPVLYSEASEQAGSSSDKFEELQRIMKRPSTSTNVSSQAKRLKLPHQSIYQEQGHEEVLDSVMDNRQRQPERTTEIKVGLANSGESSNVDHAKIISEVLKQYPHLVKNSKNIKLKILNPSIKSEPKKSPMQAQAPSKRPSILWHERSIKQEVDDNPESSYVSDVMDTREVARLSALGADNIKGPWLCLNCGSPGQALNFSSYRKYRSHLIDVHKARLSHNQCEFCGLKSGKRNHLLHHLYTKHGVPPPRNYSFPKCNQCDYIALTQAFLVKHKNSHVRQTTIYPHQTNKSNKCTYCFRVFQRESNLYSHMKITHRAAATRDGLLEQSDEEEPEPVERNYSMKYNEPVAVPEHVQIHTQANGSIQIVRNIERANPKPAAPVQKILNASLCDDTSPAKRYTTPKRINVPRDDNANSYMLTNEQSKLQDRIVIVNENEYLMSAEEVHETESIEDNAGEENGNQFTLSETEEYTQERHTLNFTMPQHPSEHQVQPKVNTEAPHVAPPPKIIKRQVKPLVQEPSDQVQVLDQQQYKALVSSSSLIFGDDSVNSAVNSIASSNLGVRAPTTHASDIVILQDVTVSRAMPGENSNIVVVYSHAVDPNDKDYIPIDAAFLESHEAAQRACNADVPVSQPQVTRILTQQGVVQETVWQNAIQQDQGSIVEETRLISGDTMDKQIIDSEPEYQNETIIEEINLQEALPTEIAPSDEMEISFETSIKEQHTLESEINENNSKDNDESTQLSDVTRPSLELATIQLDYQNDIVEDSKEEDDVTDMQVNEDDQIVHTEEIVTECTDNVEVEESIENIEQEVQKHLKQRQEQQSEESQNEDETEACSEMEVSDAIPDGAETVSLKNTSKVNEAVKISLLTDWDENDMPSEVELMEIKASDDSKVVETEMVEEMVVPEEAEPIQDKNKIEINTLVQDWDDDSQQDEN